MEDFLLYLDKFIYYQEIIEGKSDNTVKSYRHDIKQFFNYIDEYEEIDDLDNIEVMSIRSFMAYLSTLNVGKRSINRKISSLRSFFSYLKNNEIIKTNNVSYITMPKFEKNLPSVLTVKDIKQLREVINTSKIIGIRDRAIIELLYSSGIRSIELLDLRENMIDLNERELRVIGKGNKERITFFSENAKKWLSNYIELKQKNYKNYTPDVVFTNSRGGKLTSRSLRRLVSDYAEKAELKKEVTPHIFRHSFATELLNNGVDIRYLQELLGHSSISTTQVYTHVSKALLKDIYMQTHPFAKKNDI